uniref:Uncharacterized protein n=1 Tax=Knipowitschia caucasica TaxID=637954 RepID=A0AAV2MMP7_KNICA
MGLVVMGGKGIEGIVDVGVIGGGRVSGGEFGMGVGWKCGRGGNVEGKRVWLGVGLEIGWDVGGGGLGGGGRGEGGGGIGIGGGGGVVRGGVVGSIFCLGVWGVGVFRGVGLDVKGGLGGEVGMWRWGMCCVGECLGIWNLFGGLLVGGDGVVIVCRGGDRGEDGWFGVVVVMGVGGDGGCGWGVFGCVGGVFVGWGRVGEGLLMGWYGFCWVGGGGFLMGGGLVLEWVWRWCRVGLGGIGVGWFGKGCLRWGCRGGREMV